MPLHDASRNKMISFIFHLKAHPITDSEWSKKKEEKLAHNARATADATAETKRGEVCNPGK